jgi:predicted ribosomally synthesized peptide with SipW-like signal peptide
MGVHRSTVRTIQRRKVMALISMVTAVGFTSLGTLAAWNDNEWVFGGAGPSGAGTPGVGTSTFEVVQDTWTGTPPATHTWADHEENPGDALVFNVDPNTLSPGKTIYAPVALTTTATSIGGTLQLQKPVRAMPDAERIWNDVDNRLWNNLRYSVWVTEEWSEAASCRDFASAPVGATVLFDDLLFTAPVPVRAQALGASGGNIQYYCFAITLPNNAVTQTLQGRAVFPAWRFAAESV